MEKVCGRIAVALALVLIIGPRAGRAAGTLYTVLHDGSANERLASVTPSTAALNLLGTGIANCCGVSNASTIDTAGNVFYFVGVTTADPATPRLFQFDTTTGAQLAASGVALSAANSYNVIEWDPSSSKLYALARPTATTTEQLVTINTTTGALTNVGAAITSCCQFQGGSSALGNGKLLFFGGLTTDGAGVERLVSIDLATGTIANDPTIDPSNSYSHVAFDPDTGTIFGMARITASSSEEVVSIDPVTGTVTPIGVATATCCSSSGTGAYDSSSNVLYFTGGFTADAGAVRLMGFSTTSGAVVSQPLWTVGNNYNFLEFDLVPPPPPPAPTGTKTVSGTFQPGGAITYTVVVTNGGTGAEADNAGHEFTDALSADLTLVSASATSGTVSTAANTVSWDGALAPSASVTITIHATINPGTIGHVVQNQGTIAFDSNGDGTNDASAMTDDPAVVGAANPTSFTVLAPPPPAPTATKTVSGTFQPGGAITYTVVLTNGGTGIEADDAGHEFTDLLPADLTLVSASATTGTASTGPSTEFWDGALAPGASVTITIHATINPGTVGHVVQNQGAIAFDSDGDGTNDANAMTDDPAVAGAANPTSFTVQAVAAAPVPALGPAGLLLCALGLLLAGLLALRRRHA